MIITLHLMPFTRKRDDKNCNGRSSGLAFTLPSRPVFWDSGERKLPVLTGRFTATGIAPDFNRIPF